MVIEKRKLTTPANPQHPRIPHLPLPELLALQKPLSSSWLLESLSNKMVLLRFHIHRCKPLYHGMMFLLYPKLIIQANISHMKDSRRFAFIFASRASIFCCSIFSIPVAMRRCTPLCSVYIVSTFLHPLIHSSTHPFIHINPSTHPSFHHRPNSLTLGELELSLTDPQPSMPTPQSPSISQPFSTTPQPPSPQAATPAP